MASLPKPVNMIHMLAANEEAVGQLYDAYANEFPEHEEFWFGLSMEEADHSNWILELVHRVNEGSATFFKDRITIDDIQSFANYLKELNWEKSHF